MRLKRLAASLAVGLLLVAAADAKEGAEAHLLSRLPARAAPGTTINVRWSVDVPGRRGARVPFGAIGMFVRLVGPSGQSTTATARQLYGPPYSVRIRVPAGGISRIRFGLHGSTDVFFPLTSRSSESRWRTYRYDGLTARYPTRWDATSHPLTAVTDPAQVIAIASYRLPRSSHGANGCQPTGALDRMPAAGALIYGWEWRKDSGFGRVRIEDFPDRPPHFKLPHEKNYECLGRSYLLNFRDHGRYFQVHIAFGRKASASTRATALRVLDTFAAE